jgi:hypothetical protein
LLEEEIYCIHEALEEGGRGKWNTEFVTVREIVFAYVL